MAGRTPTQGESSNLTCFEQDPYCRDDFRLSEVSRPISMSVEYVEHDARQVLDIIMQYAEDHHLQVNLVLLAHASYTFLFLDVLCVLWIVGEVRLDQLLGDRQGGDGAGAAALHDHGDGDGGRLAWLPGEADEPGVRVAVP